MAKPMEAVLADLNVARIKAELLGYPDVILEQKKVVRSRREAYAAADMERSIVEAELVTSIAGEVNPAGKPAYSNAEARAAELARRKAADASYQEAARTAKNAEFALAEATDRLEAMQEKYRSYRYVAQLVAGEMYCYAAADAAAELNDEVRYVPTDKAMALEIELDGEKEPY